jgi:glycosyltransferase involved in cell wall biosynthesis
VGASARVCVVTSSHGAFDARIFKKECYSLVKAGYSVVLLAPTDSGLQRVDGVTVKGFGKPKSRLHRAVRLLRVVALALAERACVYHVHEPELLALLPFVRALRRRSRFVYDAHEDYGAAVVSPEKHYIPIAVKPLLARVVDWIEGFLARRADLVVAAGPDIERRFADCHTVCVRNFAPLHIIEPIRQRAIRDRSGNGRGRVVVYSGSLTRSRGVVELVKALELMPQSPDVSLLITGWFHDGALRREVEQLPGYARVRFVGRTRTYEENMEALATADAAVMVFHPDPNFENAVHRSNKLYEYMAMGLPVIISNLPAWADLVAGHDCGVVVDPGDPADIAAKMSALLADPARARQMGENGRQAALTVYNWEGEGARLVEAYSRLSGDVQT